MSQIEKNTVSSKNQLKESEYVEIFNENSSEIKILFAGNSITKHAPNEEIGWSGNWGMAASSFENDYVHLTVKKLKEQYEKVSYCICQVSEWENNYKNEEFSYDLYAEAREFSADIIVMRCVENCRVEEVDEVTFKKEYKKLIDYLNYGKNAKIILTTSFWHHPTADEIIRKIGKENGYPVVELGQLGEMEAMKATGLFKHGGVAIHPGDLGMKTIADKIFEEIKKLYNKGNNKV